MHSTWGVIHISKAQPGSKLNSPLVCSSLYSCKPQHMALGSGQSNWGGWVFRKLRQSYSSQYTPKRGWRWLGEGSSWECIASAHPLYILS